MARRDHRYRRGVVSAVQELMGARMADEPTRGARPRENLPEAVRNMVQLWASMAEVAADVAHAKRAIFLAYVAEGFTETQALELVKTI